MTTLTEAGLVLVPAGPGDEAFCRALFEHDRAASLSGLPYAQAVALLGIQYAGWRASLPEGHDSRVALAGEQPVGHVVLDHRDGSTRVVWVAVAAGSRGAGTGRRILTAVVEEAHAAGRDVALRVAHDNHAARSLYRSLGFTVDRADTTDLHLILPAEKDPR